MKKSRPNPKNKNIKDTHPLSKVAPKNKSSLRTVTLHSPIYWGKLGYHLCGQWDKNRLYMLPTSVNFLSVKFYNYLLALLVGGKLLKVQGFRKTVAVI